jgi:hypothetical protein
MRRSYIHVALGAIIAVIFLAGISCTKQRELSQAKQEIYFNQVLLRDAVTNLSKMWNTEVILDQEVSRIDDLWIDYAPKSPVSLQQALDDIIAFVGNQHQKQLKWWKNGTTIRVSLKDS